MYPHCDSNVLHAPGECKYCDRHPVAQLERKIKRINFTGHHDIDKTSCPSEVVRPLETINKWGGNVPVPEGMTTIMYSPELVTEEEADEFWKELEADFGTRYDPEPENPSWWQRVKDRLWRTER